MIEPVARLTNPYVNAAKMLENSLFLTELAAAVRTIEWHRFQRACMNYKVYVLIALHYIALNCINNTMHNLDLTGSLIGWY